MSVETLRKAAALMRARAEDASEGPWEAYVLGSEGYDVRGPRPESSKRLRPLRVARCGYEEWDTDKANAAHIASWHPAVALAVADWLDLTAGQCEMYGPNMSSPWTQPHEQAALAVARAYLGGAA